jgi:hypothetical protein
MDFLFVQRSRHYSLEPLRRPDAVRHRDKWRFRIQLLSFPLSSSTLMLITLQ